MSKGCFLISIPVEVIKKYADNETIAKMKKCIKYYPSDRELVDCYIETSRWKVYKELVIGRIIKDREKRRNEKQPGSMVSTRKPITRPQLQQRLFGEFLLYLIS